MCQIHTFCFVLFLLQLASQIIQYVWKEIESLAIYIKRHLMSKCSIVLHDITAEFSHEYEFNYLCMNTSFGRIYTLAFQIHIPCN